MKVQKIEWKISVFLLSGILKESLIYTKHNYNHNSYKQQFFALMVYLSFK